MWPKTIEQAEDLLETYPWYKKNHVFSEMVRECSGFRRCGVDGERIILTLWKGGAKCTPLFDYDHQNTCLNSKSLNDIKFICSETLTFQCENSKLKIQLNEPYSGSHIVDKKCFSFPFHLFEKDIFSIAAFEDHVGKYARHDFGGQSKIDSDNPKIQDSDPKLAKALKIAADHGYVNADDILLCASLIPDNSIGYYQSEL